MSTVLLLLAIIVPALVSERIFRNRPHRLASNWALSIIGGPFIASLIIFPLGLIFGSMFFGLEVLVAYLTALAVASILLAMRLAKGWA